MLFERTRQYGVALAGALAIHVAALVALGLSIVFHPLETPPVEPRIVAVSLPVPPPPDVEVFGAVDAPVMIPHFRPRMPLGLSPEQRQRMGDPALAVWKYLCNRDHALGDAVKRDCPESDFSAVDLSVRDPLNRQGDSGAILGNDTATMSLDEAGVARGWTKRPPPRGQSGLASATDQVNQPDGPELYKSLPSLKHPIEGAADPR